MTALDVWLLLAKITLFLELIEYAIVLQIRFSNACFDYPMRRGNRMKPKESVERRSDEDKEEFVMAKCKRMDSRAFLGFLLGSIFINFVYFTYYW